MDRWSIVTTLNYLTHDAEEEIVLAKAPAYGTPEGKKTISAMVRVADMTRNAFVNGDLSTVMSPRTVITWARECGDLRRYRLRLPPHLPEQVRRAGTRQRGGILSALLWRGTAGERGQGAGGVDAWPAMKPDEMPGTPSEPFKRAVSGGGALARGRAGAGSQLFSAEPAALQGAQGPPALAAAQSAGQRSRPGARHRRCLCPAPGLSRRKSAQPVPARIARRRGGVRGGGTGAGGSHRLAGHEGRGGQSRRRAGTAR